jgi:monoamine oxidase
MSASAAIDSAVQAITRWLGRGSVVGAWAHDWLGDPWARGAYSYVLTGGYEAALTLAEPFDDTLFIAGEATARDEQRGTAEGAIASGLRAARSILALRRGTRRELASARRDP